ncbi:MAG: phage tail tip lysozyme [Alphaproteobacteria bacterium]|nr:phage tail tip lysozyme [Alphaproteobacteria bacterium]
MVAARHHSDQRNDPAANRRRVLEHLTTAYNFQQHQIQAVMAAIQHESTFRLGVVGDRNLGRGREAYGLFQWREERKHGLDRFVAARPHQDEVTAHVDYAMHEMGIARRDNSNVPGPRWNIEVVPGNMLRRATNLAQAVEAMHRFERYDNRFGETNKRHRTAMGFFREVGDAIQRAFTVVRDAAVGAFNYVFGGRQPDPPHPDAHHPDARRPEAPPHVTTTTSVWRMQRHTSADMGTQEHREQVSYTQYGVPIRSPEQRPLGQVVPMKRPITAGPHLHPAPAFVMHRHRQPDEPHPPRA